VAEVDALLRSVLSNLVNVGDKTAQLPLRQFHVCVLLLGGPLSMSQLSDRLDCSMSAATQLADRLERTGMVARLAGDADRRVRCLTLTAKGRDALEAHDKLRLQRLAGVFELLNDPARRKIVAGLKLFQDACLRASRESNT